MDKRTLYKKIWDQLSADKPMVMLAGPRQAGKTTFARDIVSKDFADVIYFNWDLAKDKEESEPRSKKGRGYCSGNHGFQQQIGVGGLYV